MRITRKHSLDADTYLYVCGLIVPPPSECIYVISIMFNLASFCSICEFLAFVKNCNLVFILIDKQK